MKSWVLCLLLLIVGFVINTQAKDYTAIPDSAKQKIDSALQLIKPAATTHKHNLLVFTLNVRDGKPRKGHPSIPFANYAFQQMGENTGAWSVVFSNDTLMFHPDSLAKFDAVCFNNTVGVLVESEFLRNSLLDYVWQGGGFIGIHAAGATFVQYPVYDQFPPFGIMLGGYENGGHPWKPHEWITLKLDDPDHPVNRAFDKDGFKVSDEVFQFREHYTRDKLRVLLSIDTSRTDMSMDRYILPERRNDGDLAISWVRRYGRGRIFYTSLGHNAHLNWNPVVLEHYLDGFQFALGDLEAPTTPSSRLTPAESVREQLGWQFGLSAQEYKEKSLFGTIDKTAELGLVYLDGASTQQVSDDIPKPFDQHLTDAEIKAVRNKLEDAGVCMPDWYVSEMPTDAAGCHKVFDFAKKMGVRTIVAEPKTEQLAMLAKYCQKYDIRLAIINYLHHKKEWSFQTVQMVETEPRLGACEDVVFWHLSGLEPVQVIQSLGNKLFALYVQDINNNGRLVPLGQGTVGLDAMFKTLSDHAKSPLLISLASAQTNGFATMPLKQSVSWFNYLCAAMEVK